MDLTKAALVLLSIVMASFRVSTGTVYKVGDSTGWTNTGDVDYKTWASSKTFHVGDTIVFEYNKQFQNVVRVSHKNYRACNATAPYKRFNSGNDSISIKRNGHFYYICDLPGHCESGQKVDIRVPKHGAKPPQASPPSIPTPAPSQSPPPQSYSPAPSPHNGVSSLFSPVWVMSLLVVAHSVFHFVF